MKRLSFLVVGVLLALLGSVGAKAQMQWEIQIGGMATYPKDYDLTGKFTDNTFGNSYAVNALAGLNFFFPIGRSPFYVETGLRYRYLPWQYKQTGSTDKYDYVRFTTYGIEHKSALEVPVKAGYSLRFNPKNSLQIGVGVYLQYMMGIGKSATSEYRDYPEHSDHPTWGYLTDGEMVSRSDGFTVGLQPSLTYLHRAMSVGVMLSTPFYNGANNRFATQFTVTVGLRFNSEGWNRVGNTTLEAIDAARSSSADFNNENAKTIIGTGHQTY